jgi:hypothetical protein
MGRLSNEEKAKREKEVKTPVKRVSIDILREIAELEKQVKAKKKEYSEMIASERVVNRQPTVHECLQMSMRDDKNSERKKLQKVTAMAINALKASK